ncbi:MAG TPA: DUF1015 domain-containing protein [Streptosporangiaceae bacterium]
MQILPSDSGPASSGLVLAPFRGVRYDPARVSGLARVTSPPYDVIGSENEDQLLAADPHNVVRIIRPHHQAGQPGSAGADAAADLRAWLADAILIPDRQPALYGYEQLTASPEGTPGHLQRGLIGAVGLTPRSAGIILPHEAVAPGPVAGRLALMSATEANLEPIFLLYDGTPGPGAPAGAATRILTAAADGRPPLAEAVTPDGIRHRLWAITDTAELAAIAADLQDRTALIADGHHRYAAYLKLQERRRAAGDGAGPWDFGLALLVDSAACPPAVGAIHRVVPGLALDQAAQQAGTAFTVAELPGGTADLPAALAALADAGRAGVAFLLTGDDRAVLLTSPDPEQVAAAMPGRPAQPWHHLPAAVLADLLMERIWRVRDDETAVRAIHDPAAAVRAAQETPGTVAVLCAPMTAADVYEVAAQGAIVPRKSTSFGPKPRTGLVLRLFAES